MIAGSWYRSITRPRRPCRCRRTPRPCRRSAPLDRERVGGAVGHAVVAQRRERVARADVLHDRVVVDAAGGRCRRHGRAGRRAGAARRPRSAARPSPRARWWWSSCREGARRRRSDCRGCSRTRRACASRTRSTKRRIPPSWSGLGRRIAGRRYDPAMADDSTRRTDSGIEVKPQYTAADLDGLGIPPPRSATPDSPPYTRGVYAQMYRSRPWTMRQYSGFGTAAETNERFHFLLGAGQTGLSCAFDLPTQMGYDSDHPRAEGEVGKVGVAIDSLEDMEILLGGPAARHRHHVDDDQLDGRDPAAALRAGRGEERRAGREDRRDDPERHPQGVRRPRHLHLPAAAVDADHHRHLRLLR